MRGGCLELLVSAIVHATGPEAPPQEEVCSILGSAVAALRQITKLEGSGYAATFCSSVGMRICRLCQAPAHIFLSVSGAWD